MFGIGRYLFDIGSMEGKTEICFFAAHHRANLTRLVYFLDFKESTAS